MMDWVFYMADGGEVIRTLRLPVLSTPLHHRPLADSLDPGCDKKSEGFKAGGMQTIP